MKFFFFLSLEYPPPPPFCLNGASVSCLCLFGRWVFGKTPRCKSFWASCQRGGAVWRTGVTSRSSNRACPGGWAALGTRQSEGALVGCLSVSLCLFVSVSVSVYLCCLCLSVTLFFFFFFSHTLQSTRVIAMGYRCSAVRCRSVVTEQLLSVTVCVSACPLPSVCACMCVIWLSVSVWLYAVLHVCPCIWVLAGWLIVLSISGTGLCIRDVVHVAGVLVPSSSVCAEALVFVLKLWCLCGSRNALC